MTEKLISGIEMRDRLLKRLNSEKEFGLLVFIGRFQPFHKEHKRIIDIALKKANRVLVLVGSAGGPRTIRNPFTFDERKTVIEESFDDPADFMRLDIKPIYDKTYNDTAWIKQVQDVVYTTALDIVNGGPNAFRNHGLNDIKVGLIGASKDQTSYYLKMFPQFESVDVKIEHEIHATAIRELYLNGSAFNTDVITKRTLTFLTEFKNTAEYQQLQTEQKFVENYKKQWAAAPYPPIFVTTDAAVVQSGHILLVKRRAAPGKGLLALPGGFLNQNEKIIDGIIRELREETKIKVPEPALRGSISKLETFDEPNRSSRGRTITHCALIELENGPLPKVKGSDDAIAAAWHPLSSIEESMFFEDHWHIIQYLVNP